MKSDQLVRCHCHWRWLPSRPSQVRRVRGKHFALLLHHLPPTGDGENAGAPWALAHRVNTVPSLTRYVPFPSRPRTTRTDTGILVGGPSHAGIVTKANVLGKSPSATISNFSVASVPVFVSTDFDLATESRLVMAAL